MSERAAGTPVPGADAVLSSWQANAAAWTRAVRGGRIASRREVTDAAIGDAVLALAPRRVLDVGCGEGWLARALAARGIEVVGVDAVPGLVDAARSAGGGEFHVLAYEALARADLGAPFDVVACNFSLLGEDDAPLVLAAARRRGTANLRVVIQTVHPHAVGDGVRSGWRTEDWRAFDASFPVPAPWYFRTAANWRNTIAAAGFRIDEWGEPGASGASGPASLLLVCEPA